VAPGVSSPAGRQHIAPLAHALVRRIVGKLFPKQPLKSISVNFHSQVFNETRIKEWVITALDPIVDRVAIHRLEVRTKVSSARTVEIAKPLRKGAERIGKELLDKRSHIGRR
jgi:hypothetical protein